MGWKVGDPADPGACGKCCGQSTDTIYDHENDDCHSPSSPQSGIYPGAGKTVYLKVDWDQFTPTSSGWFERANIAGGDRWPGPDGYITRNENGGGDYVDYTYNNELSANVTLEKRLIGINPFTLELNMAVYDLPLDTGEDGLTDCAYGTPNILAKAEADEIVYTPTDVVLGSLDSSDTLEDYEDSLAAAGLLEVDMSGFADYDVLEEYIVPPDFPSFPEHPSDDILESEFPINSRKSRTATFGKVFAGAILNISNNRPTFHVKLIQAVDWRLVYESADENGENWEIDSETDIRTYTTLFDLQDYYVDPTTLYDPPYGLEFGCPDYPVNLGEDGELIWEQENVDGRSSAGGSEPWFLWGRPNSSIFSEFGGSIANQEKYTGFNTDAGPHQQLVTYDPLDEHPDNDPPSRTAIVVTTLFNDESSVYPANGFSTYEEEFDGETYTFGDGPHTGPVNQHGSAIVIVNYLGMANLTVTVIGAADQSGCPEDEA